MKDKMNKSKKLIIIIIAIILMYLSFSMGIFIPNIEERKHFDNFQKDSESLVIGRIYNDYYGFNSKYGLRFIKPYGENGEEFILEDYKSQVGIQGKIFSFMFNKMHIPIEQLNNICALLTAIVLVAICYLLYEKYGTMFSVVFYIVFLLSPWIVDFARNLYWVEFLWFIPLLLCLLLDKTKNKGVFLPLIFIAVFLKCLCGYEYLSTILLTSITFFILDFILVKEKRKQIFITVFEIGCICIFAFILAICLHALIRGDGNLINGINTIYKEDVLRRTMGNNTELFEDQRVKASIEASYTSVYLKYFQFYTDIIYCIPGYMFVIIVIISLVIIMYNVLSEKENSNRDAIIYLIFFISTSSWHILAKAHSYIHLHMNYVLWYFGYMQMCIYIIVKSMNDGMDYIISKGRIKNGK